MAVHFEGAYRLPLFLREIILTPALSLNTFHPLTSMSLTSSTCVCVPLYFRVVRLPLNGFRCPIPGSSSLPVRASRSLPQLFRVARPPTLPVSIAVRTAVALPPDSVVPPRGVLVPFVKFWTMLCTSSFSACVFASMQFWKFCIF